MVPLICKSISFINSWQDYLHSTSYCPCIDCYIHNVSTAVPFGLHPVSSWNFEPKAFIQFSSGVHCSQFFCPSLFISSLIIRRSYFALAMSLSSPQNLGSGIELAIFAANPLDSLVEQSTSVD